jgi:hypothetical protein
VPKDVQHQPVFWQRLGHELCDAALLESLAGQGYLFARPLIAEDIPGYL